MVVVRVFHMDQYQQITQRWNAPLGSEPDVDASARVVDSCFEEWVSIGPHNRIVASQIGAYTYTGEHVTIQHARVGRFTNIAAYVSVGPVNHPMDRVTLHHMTYRRRAYGVGEQDDETLFYWRQLQKADIGHDVWIGHGAIILAGVSVGTGSVVGAGSVVTKDVEPFSVVAGNPAKPIKRRFAKSVAEALMRVAWWNWSRDELLERFHDFYDLREFLARYDPARPLHQSSSVFSSEMQEKKSEG